MTRAAATVGVFGSPGRDRTTGCCGRAHPAAGAAVTAAAGWTTVVVCWVPSA